MNRKPLFYKDYGYFCLERAGSGDQKNGAKKEKKQTSSRGRKRDDVAIYLLHRLWAWAVYKRSIMSWEQLDDTFLNDSFNNNSSRLRCFESFGRHGINPLSKERLASKVNLVKLVGSTPAFGGTEEIFVSIFWELLTLPNPSPADIDRIFVAVLDRLGLFQSKRWQSQFGTAIFPFESAFGPVTEDDRIAHLFVEDPPTFDQLAFLVCLFRISHSRLSDEAAFYKRAVGGKLAQLFLLWETPDDIRAALQYLVKKRLLHWDWRAESDEEVGITRRSRQRAVKSEIKQMQPSLTQSETGAEGDNAHWYTGPIVPINENLSWFAQLCFKWESDPDVTCLQLMRTTNNILRLIPKTES